MQQPNKYQNLNLKAWPFQVVPDPNFARIWAGRRQTEEQLKRLLWKMEFAPKSSLHLLWADFGMGKTHTLLHLQHLIAQAKAPLVPVYAVMPKRATKFLEVYRAIVSELPLDYLGEQLIRLGSSTSGTLSQHAIFSKSPGILSALLAVRSGDIQKGQVARQWLAAQPGLSASDRRIIGVTYRIATAEDALNALTTLTRLATYRNDSQVKLVILLDEFQRIGELNKHVTNEINSAMHTFYNDNPNRLVLFLAFSFGNKDNLHYLLSPELRSRADLDNINLEVLTELEGQEFIKDLLSEARLKADTRWAFPFAPDAITAIIQHIAQSKRPITPRRLMNLANHVLLESRYRHGPQDDSETTIEEVKRLLESTPMDLDLTEEMAD